MKRRQTALTPVQSEPFPSREALSTGSSTLETMGEARKVDPINLARQIGEEAHGLPGAKVFPELEKAFILSNAQPLARSPEFRLRQHLFIYSPPAMLKDTMIRVFNENCIPTGSYPTVNLSDTSIQSCMGGLAKDGHFHPPAFYGYKMVYITEFLAFMESAQAIKKQIGVLNKLLEGDEVVRDILKVSEIDTELEFWREDHDGLKLDERKIYYKCHSTFVFCSHILEPSLMDFLEENAFLSRVKFIRLDVTDDEHEKNMRNPIIEWNYPKLRLLGLYNKKLLEMIPKERQ